jgi:O-glycosyl hydrolase
MSETLKIKYRPRWFFLIAAILLTVTLTGQTKNADIKVDGSVRYQTLEGFGVNINPSWWYKGEYGDAKTIYPAIDMLIDSLGATIYRVVVEEIDWETVNDDNDPFHFNRDYYNNVFSGKKFRCVWDVLRHLNSKGIRENLMISFMGAGPSPAPGAGQDPSKNWMGGTDYTIRPDMEDELAESIAAFLCYARKNEGISFSLVSPMNETDIEGLTKSPEHPYGLVEGPDISDPEQYVRIIRKLAKRLDESGLSDICFVAPDAAGDKLFSGILAEIIKDPYLMGKLKCWGVHQYGNDAGNYRKIIERPEIPLKPFWITETAGIANMLGQLDDNATAFIFWDGFDCVYQHARRNGYGDVPPNDWAFWMKPEDGKPLIEYLPGSAGWRPRKQFYQHYHLMKFIRPGAVRVQLTGTDSALLASAFLNENGELVVTGYNLNDRNLDIRLVLSNLPNFKNPDLLITSASKNISASANIKLTGSTLSATIPSKSVFTIKANPVNGLTGSRPEPEGWYSGDMHVHRNCGEVTGITAESDFQAMMRKNDLSVISLLADMGNGEVRVSSTDLPKVTGSDAQCSLPGRIVHWDAEWHFDPAGVTFENQALGGHLVFLGLKEAHTIWDESAYKILEWGRGQNAIAGFCHMEYLNDSLPQHLTCCIPIDYPVEAALGTIDFLSEDVWINDEAIKGYYRILNCGIRIAWTAGTDFPCNNSEPLGTLLTYVNLKDKPLTYQNWIEGIKAGRTVVSTNAHSEFMSLKINNSATPGDEIKINGKTGMTIEADWSSVCRQEGRIEIICNGKVVAVQEGISLPGSPLHLKTNLTISESSRICARRMDSTGHRSHTGPVYISCQGRPVRASEADARFYIAWIDNILQKIEPGAPWSRFFTHDLDKVRSRYLKARSIYEKIAVEASERKNPD